MLVSFMHFCALYLVFGFIVALGINALVVKSNEEAFTPTQILYAIILWPITLLVFIWGMIIGFIQRNS